MRTTLAILVSLTLSTSAYAKPQPKPQVKMEAAKATALQRVPGKIKSAELETEKGKLVYSFDIITADKKIMEVQIDAMNGAVVEVAEETPEHERQEEQKDRKRTGKKP
jgi:uncharacterized membrane protein YkoI